MAVIEGSSSMVSILKWSWLENGEERRCEETWRSHGEGVEADRHLDYGEPNVRVNVISRTKPLSQRVGAGDDPNARRGGVCERSSEMQGEVEVRQLGWQKLGIEDPLNRGRSAPPPLLYPTIDYSVPPPLQECMAHVSSTNMLTELRGLRLFTLSKLANGQEWDFLGCFLFPKSNRKGRSFFATKLSLTSRSETSEPPSQSVRRSLPTLLSIHQ
jgi:hypothetical protein